MRISRHNVRAFSYRVSDFFFFFFCSYNVRGVDHSENRNIIRTDDDEKRRRDSYLCRLWTGLFNLINLILSIRGGIYRNVRSCGKHSEYNANAKEKKRKKNEEWSSK